MDVFSLDRERKLDEEDEDEMSLPFLEKSEPY